MFGLSKKESQVSVFLFVRLSLVTGTKRGSVPHSFFAFILIRKSKSTTGFTEVSNVFTHFTPYLNWMCDYCVRRKFILIKDLSGAICSHI